MLRAVLSHGLHLLGEAAVGILGFATIATCLLVWRLAQGPIDITALAQREQGVLAGPGAAVAVGSVAVAWEGFREPGRALDLRIGGASVVRSDGSVLARVPKARVSLALWPLLLGRVEPRTLDLEGLVLDLRRDAAGVVQLDLGGPSGTAAPGGGAEILRDMTLPAGPAQSLPWLSQLSRVAVKGARVSVHDAELGVLWQAPLADIDLLRLIDGSVSGTARIDLAVGEVRASLVVKAELLAGATHLTATTTPVSPAALSRASPAFAALAALDAPVRASLEADLDASLSPRASRLAVSVGAGRLLAGQGAVALDGASALVSLAQGSSRLETLRVALAAVPGGHGPAPILIGSAEGGLRGANFTLALESVDMGDLGLYWPPGAGGGSRAWLTENILAGHARNAHVSGRVEAPSGWADAALTALSGGMDVDGLSVAWLKPIPPITGGVAHLDIEGPDALRIQLHQGVQGRLRITDGTVRITGLSARHQFGDIAIGMAGPLEDALALLDHPRLRLLSKRNLDFGAVGGDVQARLSIKLPLENKVGMDDIAIAAKAALADVHLAHAAAGRPLDQAELSLDIDGDGLKLAGTGQFAGIPSKLALDMDFRNGPAGQVLEHLAATGTADRAQLAKAGLPAGAGAILTGGSVGLSVDYASLRDGSGALQLDADLGAASLSTPLGWTKAAGPAAAVSGRLLLQKGSVTGLDQLLASGPGLALASHADIAQGRVKTLVVDRAALGRTQAHGRVAFPADAGGAVAVTLAGTMLDLSPVLEPGRPKADQQADAANAIDPPPVRGQSWSADLAFDQVLLAKQASVGPLRARAAYDGLHYSSADITAGGPAGFAASITPGASGRHLLVDAHDTGPILAAMGVADNLRGGGLSIDANFDDTRPNAPLSGKARLSEFNVTDAPAIGRLLQAMTLYGLTDLLRGPGLHFTRMIAPFRWEKRVLHLDNARVFSASLGLTAQGDLDLGRHMVDIQGTVVPAYFFNQLPGKIPLVGRLFSPESGGGLFAARYSVRGRLSDPKVGVNPLSALTPGFLRGLFGLFSTR